MVVEVVFKKGETMAAQIITATKVGASGTNIKIKINDGHQIPDTIVTDSVESFRTWAREDGNFFVWTNDQDQEISMIVPFAYVGWIISSIPVDSGLERFSIKDPCVVTIEDEVL
jgi:hypothetical protein